MLLLPVAIFIKRMFLLKKPARAHPVANIGQWAPRGVAEATTIALLIGTLRFFSLLRPWFLGCPPVVVACYYKYV